MDLLYVDYQMGTIVLVHWITNMHQNQIYDNDF